MKTLLIAVLVLMAATANAQSLPDKTKAMIDNIIPQVEKVSGHKAEFIGDKACRDDGFCSASFNWTQVQVYGRGVVNVLSGGTMSGEEYRSVCAAVFAGLTGNAQDNAEALMQQAFAQGLQRGRLRFDRGSVQVQISTTSSGAVECGFFKY
ncbi:MAG: hypothetical protein AAFQ10_03465 [Pseudomonadota bacterium]